MNKVIFIISIFFSAGIGYFVGVNRDLLVIEAPSSTNATQNVLKHPEVGNSSRHHHENNFHGDAVPPTTQAAPHAKVLTQDASQLAQQQIDAAKTEYESRQRSEAFTRWLTNHQKEKSWFDLGIEMRGRFDTEETDHIWALAEEAHLQSLFSQVPALAGVALKSAHCKSTQCQITISVMDNDHANETSMAISQVLGSEGTAQIIIDNQIQQGEAILYVSRNEKGFEFN